MSKSKSSSKGAVPAASNVLTKVKDAAITKPAQTVKAKSKELAKQVAGKEDKKTKSKKVKEPTPESSDADSEEDDDDSEDDSEVELKKPAQKANGKSIPKVAKPVDSDSDESDSSDAEAPTNGHVKASVVKKAAIESSDDDDDSDDSEAGVSTVKPVAAAESSEDDEDDSDEDEAPAKNKGPVKAADLSKKLKPVVADNSSDEDSDEEEDDDEADSDEDSDDDEIEAKPVQPAKRKAEDDTTPAAKKTKTAEAESADPTQGSNLFVGNLSWNVDEDWLQREFEEFGEISSVRLITDRDTGRSKGFGYVEFANAAEGVKAHTAKNGAMLDGRALNVDFANQRSQGGQQDRAQSRAKSFGDQASAPSDTLFVGNLSFDAGQESVSEAFSEYGTILGVRLPTDRESGEPKGFGYVTFASVDEAKNALENMQGYEISGRACRLDYSQPRPQNGDSPGRGRGRGGFGDRGGRGRGGFDRGGRGGGRGFGGGRGRGGFDRGGRGGGRGASTNRGGFGDFSGKKVTF